jgi:hypothetical protein
VDVPAIQEAARGAAEPLSPLSAAADAGAGGAGPGHGGRVPAVFS